MYFSYRHWRAFIAVACVTIICCTAFGQSQRLAHSARIVAAKPVFRNLPERVVLTEGESYYREIAVQYRFPDSLGISLIGGRDIEDALVDMGGGRAFFYISADYKMVDSTISYIFCAKYGQRKVFDTMVVSVINRPLEVISVVPAASSEILVTEKPIRIEFNETLDRMSVDKCVNISSTRKSEFHYYYDTETNALIIDTDDRLLPTQDTITINLSSGLLDLAGHPLKSSQHLTFITGPVVYPGDANNDGIVDENDLVSLVRYWGDAGPQRTFSQPLVWAAQPARSWGDPKAGFADINGDGQVNGDDVCGIVANWGKMSGNVDFKSLYSSESPEKVLARTDQSILRDIYTAAVNCPDGGGYIVSILKSLLFDNRDNLPDEYMLYQNYPNPFNPETIIEYFLPEASQLNIAVYNIIGQKVYDLYDGFASEGFGSVTWHGIDNFGKPVASGIYFYRLEAENTAVTKRMILIR